MQSDETYSRTIITWLEQMIKCEFLDQTEVCSLPVCEPSCGGIDPRLSEAPQLAHLTEDEFEMAYKSFLHDLVVACNWHEHTDTCWKHLKFGELCDDAHCQMWMDGLTRQSTTIDETTLSILLHRLHPRINNYNDLVLFLLQCNMDIKHIGSGPGAKALVFYITDYITKNGLSVHIGLDAIKYAIRRNEQVRDFTDDAAKD